MSSPPGARIPRALLRWHRQCAGVWLRAESSEDPQGPVQNRRADRCLTPRRSGSQEQTIPVKKATDKNLLFARPQVLSAARVRENWFLGLTKHRRIVTEWGRGVNWQFLPLLVRFWPWEAAFRRKAGCLGRGLAAR